MTCFPQCHHIPITDLLKEVAREQEQKLHNQKGDYNPTTKLYSVNRDYVGSIGQNSLYEFFDNRQMTGGLEWSPYFSAQIHADEFDFRFRGYAYDVKSTEMKEYKYMTGRSWCKVYNHQRHKRVDAYVFTAVDLESDTVHIAGVIGYERFWSNAVPSANGFPFHYVEARLLKPIFGIVG